MYLIFQYFKRRGKLEKQQDPRTVEIMKHVGKLRFLPADFKALKASFEKADRALREKKRLSAEVNSQSSSDEDRALRCHQSSYTLERNRDYFRLMLDKAEKCNPQKVNGKAYLGHTIKVFDETSENERIFKIGSFLVFVNEPGVDTVSYASPIGQKLLGASVGDEISFMIRGDVRQFTVLEIWA